MDKHVHIASLVRKLRDDNVTSQELRELQQFFSSAEVQGEAEAWLVDLWESSVQHDGYSIDSEYMRRQINQKIQQQALLHHAKKSKKRLVYSFMRYAAVFLLAVGFSRLVRNEHPETQNPDANIFSGTSEISVTYGSKTRIVLPDSSVVYLNSGSRLSYPAVFDHERHVTLTGEGYFIVRSDSLHPFLVHTADVSVKALGTEFNVKAYPEEGKVETVLVSGTVEILKRGHTKPIIELKPGEKAAYVKYEPKKQSTPAVSTNIAKEQQQMIVNLDSKPDVSTGWVRNQLVFDAEPFEQIAARIERWYNVEIDIRNASLIKTRLSGRYDTENIEQVMQSLQLATYFTYKIEKNKIIIR